MKITAKSDITDYIALQAQFEQWYQSPMGRYLLQRERTLARQMTAEVYGYQLLELGVSHRIPVGDGANVGHHIIGVPGWCEQMPESSLVTLSDEIGIRHDSVDMVILHHTLDFSSKPHQSLREASRVLRSGGHLLVIGFNPYSFWGVRRLFRRRSRAPWSARFLSGRRLEDWLRLLDFRIDAIRHTMYSPPFGNYRDNDADTWLDRIGERFHLPMGGVYAMLAQKQVGARLHSKPSWKKAKVVGLPVANRVARKADHVT